jgi:DNA-binding MarR family transcriptional regulator
MPRSITPPLEELAEFRHLLRRFLAFSEDAAARHHLPAQQHQLLLQIAGAPAGTVTTVAYLAQRLVLRHHTVVELSTRCEGAGLIARSRHALDARVVVLSLTEEGHRLLHELSADHARELTELAPALLTALHPFADRKKARP